jgi:hypothetical protein
MKANDQHPSTMKKILVFAASSSLLALAQASAETDCLQLSHFVKTAVASEPSKVLQLVEEKVSENPACACEVVKAAIEGAVAEPETVSAIVETAITAAPDQMRLIAQCAIAAAPDALTNVQAVLAKLDPNSGESGDSAKSAKGAKSPAGEVAAMPNPLDFPGKGPVRPLFPIFPPVIINPPRVTQVNPGPPFKPPGPPFTPPGPPTFVPPPFTPTNGG